MKFLATLGEARLISNPKIAVINNHEARIHVGRQEAYITSTTTAAQTTTTTAEDVTFIDVGIQLTVTPRINSDGYVTMRIIPEVSSVIRFLTTAQDNTIPIVDTSTAETTVMVKDNSTIFIGGLRKKEEQTTSKQIPFLGHVPIFGPLFFKQTDRDDTTAELVVMITPHIVYGDELVTGDEQAVTSMEYREYGPVLSDSTLWGEP